MIRTKLRKRPNKDIKKTNLGSRKTGHSNTDYCISKQPSQVYESSGSQSSQHNIINTNNNNKNCQMKSSKIKDDYVPLTVNPEHRKSRGNSTNPRKKIYPIKSDSSIEVPKVIIRQQYQQNRPSTAATSQRKKHTNHTDFIIKDKNNIEKDFIVSEENDADNCFQIIKEAIEEVIQNSLQKILATQIPIINQKLEEVHNYMQKNEDDLANCFKELEARITHYGEDQGRHIRYLCMKLEFDKLLHNHLGNLVVTSSGHSRCCQSTRTAKSYTSCTTHKQQPQQQQQQQQQHLHQHQQQQHQQQQPQSTCSCCFDNTHRMDHTIPTQDSQRCSSPPASTLRCGGHSVNISNHESKPVTRCEMNLDRTTDSPTKNHVHILHQCGDGQQQDLNNKSVLSILEELKKRNSSDMKTSSLLKTNITNNSDDYNCLYNAQNVSSDNTADVGLKDILATIQKYYPIVDKNVFEDIRHANNNRIDMELELDKDIDTVRSYEE